MELDFVDRLLSYWKNQGLILANGNADGVLAEFESKYSILLPNDMRRYLSAANGMSNIPGRDSDSNGFRFWPLEEIKPTVAACEVAGVPLLPGQNSDRLFIFADYFDWSWAYAIDLSETNRESQPVIHIGTLESKTVAQSFTEFVNLYLEDAKVLYVTSRSLDLGRGIDDQSR
jgi:hypothetical protein